MYRNTGGRFSEAPQANIKRSIFQYKNIHKTTFNVGDLVPIFVNEVLPGDTFDINVSSLVRLATPLHPTMDNLFLDTYFFFVPNRLLWDNFTKFMGENDNAWAQDTDSFTPPFLDYGGSSDIYNHRIGVVSDSSILNYLGIPVISSGGSKKVVSATILDFNAYCKIFNDWFRDENLMDEIPIYKGDGGLPSNYYLSYANYLANTFGITGGLSFNDSGSCLKASKYHDYFTSALPAPQKGPDVLIPAGGDVILNLDNFATNAPTFVKADGTYGGSNPVFQDSNQIFVGNGFVDTSVAYDPNGTLKLDGLEITVNNLRLAIQTQKLLEADARGGRVRALCLHVKKIAEKIWKATAIVLC